MIADAVRTLWAEPRAPAAPARVWRDWALVALLLTAAVLETVLRDDLVWRGVALAMAGVVALALLWRRTHPLAAVTFAFGTATVLSIAAALGPGESVGLDSSICVLLLPYALFRWGSGREIALGVPVIVLVYVVGVGLDWTGLGEAIGALFVLNFPAALGAFVRIWKVSRLRELDQVKLLERQQLARELHDTVAHHVSAIAIQAQAGLTVAASRPDSAVRALERIEEEASRTLAEMRTMVAVLRDGDGPELAPQRGVADIRRLARDDAQGPRVEVVLAGDLEALRPAVGAAIYRLAQESVTNALQHAREATRIHVSVAGEADCVRLTVHDDGTAAATGRSGPGYGLVGMTERAALLGGTLEAGPGPGHGWTVSATLPRSGR